MPSQSYNSVQIPPPIYSTPSPTFYDQPVMTLWLWSLILWRLLISEPEAWNYCYWRGSSRVSLSARDRRFRSGVGNCRKRGWGGWRGWEGISGVNLSMISISKGSNSNWKSRTPHIAKHWCYYIIGEPAPVSMLLLTSFIGLIMSMLLSTSLLTLIPRILLREYYISYEESTFSFLFYRFCAKVAAHSSANPKHLAYHPLAQ